MVGAGRMTRGRGVRGFALTSRHAGGSGKSGKSGSSVYGSCITSALLSALLRGYDLLCRVEQESRQPLRRRGVHLDAEPATSGQIEHARTLRYQCEHPGMFRDTEHHRLRGYEKAYVWRLEGRCWCVCWCISRRRWRVIEFGCQWQSPKALFPLVPNLSQRARTRHRQ